MPSQTTQPAAPATPIRFFIPDLVALMFLVAFHLAVLFASDSNREISQMFLNSFVATALASLGWFVSVQRYVSECNFPVMIVQRIMAAIVYETMIIVGVMSIAAGIIFAIAVALEFPALALLVFTYAVVGVSFLWIADSTSQKDANKVEQGKPHER